MWAGRIARIACRVGTLGQARLGEVTQEPIMGTRDGGEAIADPKAVLIEHALTARAGPRTDVEQLGEDGAAGRERVAEGERVKATPGPAPPVRAKALVKPGQGLSHRRARLCGHPLPNPTPVEGEGRANAVRPCTPLLLWERGRG